MGTAFEKDYFESRSFRNDCSLLAGSLADLTSELKSEEHILNGGTVSAEELKQWKPICIMSLRAITRNTTGFIQYGKLSAFY